MEQNDNFGSTGSTGGTGNTGGLGSTGGVGSTGSTGGNTGSTGGGSGSIAGSAGAASGSGSVGSGFGSAPGSAGGLDSDFDAHETHVYRSDFDARTDRPATHTYEQARTGYELGHTAATQPAYQGRPFQEVEVELEKSYKPQGNSKFADVRDYARNSFEWKTVVGGLAVAAGGWWAGKKLLEAVSSSSKEDETHYRTHFESHPARATVTYPQARTYYVIGYTASRNPDYAGRRFEDVEPEIRRGFTGSHASNYDSMRDFCRVGYERGVGRTGSV